MNKEILRIDGVTLQIDNTMYLHNINLSIRQGEILGAISTDQQGMEELVELIVNNTPIKFGRVYFAEELVNDYLQMSTLPNPAYVIDQKLRLIPDLTVADNVLVLRKSFKQHIINSAALERQVQVVLDQLGMSIRADHISKELTPFERCVVELIKAIMSDAKLIIIQNISEMISFAGLQMFHKMMLHYQKSGVSFLYIGHHHDDVFKIANRAVIYENGEIIKILYREQMNVENITPYVKVIKEQDNEQSEDVNPVLELVDVHTKSNQGLNIRVYSRKCTTVLDQDYNTIKDILDITDKKMNPYIGSIIFEGKKITGKDQLRAMQGNVLMIPEDPIHTFLFLNQSFVYNLAFLADKKLKKSILSSHIIDSIKKEWKAVFRDCIDKTDLGGVSLKDLYSLIYYKVILYRPKVVYLMKPFVGVDMYLRVHIAELIRKLKEENIAIVLVTNYVADTLAVTDEFILIEGGRKIDGQEMYQSNIIQGNYYKDRLLNQ